MTTLTPEEQDAYDRARAFKNLAVVVALLGGIALALGWALVPSYYPSLAIGAVVGCTCIFASHWLLKTHDHAIVELTLLIARANFRQDIDAIQAYSGGLRRATDRAEEQIKEHVDEQ